MAEYEYADNITNLRYGDWLHREASLKDMKPSDLEKEIELIPITVSKIRIVDAVWPYALELFNREARKYDAVTDFSELFSQSAFGLTPTIVMRVTCVKYKSK